jgi:hypothetical protein
MIKNLTFLFAASVSIAGCANLNTVHRNLALGNSTTANAVAIDGYQLPIFSHLAYQKPDGTPVDANGNKQVFIVCPNPPVEAISANSVAAALTNSFKAGQASKSSTGSNDTQASLASAMAAASIGLRTNSTTLLSYNATSNCLAYMGGATQDRKFMELARRNQQITLAILAIEQLTGVAQAGQASLNSESGSSTGAADLAPLQTALDNRIKEDNAAKTALSTADLNTRTAKEELAAKTTTLASAQADLKKLVDGKQPEDVISAQRTVVETSKQSLVAAQKALDAAKLAEATARQESARTYAMVRHAQTALELAESNVRAQAAATAAVGQGQGPRSSATSDVANAVVKIVETVTSAIGVGETCASLRDTLITGDDKQFNRLTGEGGIALLKACAVAEGTGELLADARPNLPTLNNTKAPSVASTAPAPAPAVALPASRPSITDPSVGKAVRNLSKQSYDGFANDAKKAQDEKK